MKYHCKTGIDFVSSPDSWSELGAALRSDSFVWALLGWGLKTSKEPTSLGNLFHCLALPVGIKSCLVSELNPLCFGFFSRPLNSCKEPQWPSYKCWRRVVRLPEAIPSSRQKKSQFVSLCLKGKCSSPTNGWIDLGWMPDAHPCSSLTPFPQQEEIR